MEHLGICFSEKNLPELDPLFQPILLWNRAFLAGAEKPLGIAVERSAGQVAAYRTFIRDGEFAPANRYYADRFVKTVLWMKGGWRVYVSGDRDIYEYIRAAYSPEGSRAFDFDFMSGVYERPFKVVWCDELPEEKGGSSAVGRHLEGCRIGFDAGGSDRKVSAVIDGESVFSEEVVWNPKLNADPDYHYDGILAAFRAAAAHMPRVDAIGVSSAGVFIDNRTMVASLFLKVPKDLFQQKVKDIYLRAAAAMGDVPVSVCNDGDVSALAGAMSLGDNNVLGMAMGTSEAVGYVDELGNITGWLNELAFMPVDVSSAAMRDEWSGDIGCGVKYFSQDGVIKLAGMAGLDLSGAETPAEKLKLVQGMMAQGDKTAAAIYRSIGVYLGHTLAWYHSLYGCRHVLLLGRVMSGRGGDVIVEQARRVLDEEYPEYAEKIALDLPDEKYRRVGQSVAAASLPELKK
jgi:predicted NBD/HSP70 family sugar kinase